jgi:hypothetical protein
MSETFIGLDAFQIYNPAATTDLSDLNGRKTISIAHSLPAERALHFQIKLEDSGVDEGIDFIGLDYLVLLLSHHGIPDAKGTMNI